MGEAHKPTCSRRGSKGPVRREGAKGKRARDAATPPPRPRSSGDTQTARGARATARARNARQTRRWRQTFAAAQFREQLPGRRPVTWRTLYPQWRWRTQRHAHEPRMSGCKRKASHRRTECDLLTWSSKASKSHTSSRDKYIHGQGTMNLGLRVGDQLFSGWQLGLCVITTTFQALSAVY